MKDLVSIIMLSRNKEQYMEASVRSVIAQTYQNWELLVVDDASDDNTISLLLKLKTEDRNRFGKRDGRTLLEDGTPADRINVTKTIESRGETLSRNSALKSAKGRWRAFLDAGDIWEPTKLEKQVAFMEEHGYAFSYTKYKSQAGLMKGELVDISGPQFISHHDMKKCCWIGYPTVMYDTEKIGKLNLKDLKDANDYALWLQVAQ